MTYWKPLWILSLLVVCSVSCKTDEAQVTSDAQDAESLYFEDYQPPDARWGFIDTSGQRIIDIIYDQVRPYSEGLAPVNMAGRWGYIDKKGQVVIDYQFRAAWPFSEGVARVQCMDLTYALAYPDGSIIRLEGFDEIYDCSGGRIRFLEKRSYGYMDTSGQVLIPAAFSKAWDFENGFARVRQFGKEGLIRPDGRFFMPAEYARIYPPSEGIILAKETSGYFFMTMQAERLDDKTYPYAKPFHAGRAVVKTDAAFFIDQQGKPLPGTRYPQLRYAGASRWVAFNGRRHALIDREGTVLTPFKYSQINAFSEERAVYRSENFWGYLDISGREVTKPQFGLAWDFRDGYARAAFYDGMGYIDRDGNLALAPVFLDMRDFSEGLAPVQSR